METQENSPHIGVIGLGFVGLPLALLFADKGFPVTGIDLDRNKIQMLNNGKSYIPDIKDEKIEETINKGLFRTTDDYEIVREIDVIIICVPTPLTPFHTPDLTYLKQVANELFPRLKSRQLIILESSTYPGTTKEVLLPILEKSALNIGQNLFLAYSPERIDPGNQQFTVENIPKVVSGVTENCKQRIEQLYSRVFKKVIAVSSTEVAELTKLLENSFRFINISFMNEFAMMCDTLHVDAWEAIHAASTKPYGYSPFYPGPGIGGHCIPVDPLYLYWKAAQYGTDSKFIQISQDVNQTITDYVVDQIYKLISSTNAENKGNILICGITYKKDINDVRESPVFPIIRRFNQLGYSVSYHDPHVPELVLDQQRLSSIPLSNENLQEADCVVILTDHSSLPISTILDHAKLVYDTRNITSGLSSKARVVRLGGGNL